MSTKLRSAVSSTHIKFRDTVFGYVHQHEQDASINVAALIKYLCLDYYLLKEEWTSCWAQYPLHWIYKNGEYPQSNDWSKRTKYEVHQLVGYRPDSGDPIQAEIIRMRKNGDRDVTKLFLNFAPNTNHVPYGWITIPNDRLFPPHLIGAPRFDGISGTLPINASDESITEYRWTFELLQLRSFAIGLRDQREIISSMAIGFRHTQNFYHNSYRCIAWIPRPRSHFKKGDVLHVILDLRKQSVKVESEGQVLRHKSFTKDDIVGAGKGEIYWNPKVQHFFLVIDYGDSTTDREFGVEDSKKILKFKQFAIKQTATL